MTNDRLSVSRAPGVAFGVRLTPARRSAAQPRCASVGSRPEGRAGTVPSHERERHAWLSSARRLATVAGGLAPRAERRERRIRVTLTHIS